MGMPCKNLGHFATVHNHYLWSIRLFWNCFLCCQSNEYKLLFHSCFLEDFSFFPSIAFLPCPLVQGLDLQWCAMPDRGLPAPDVTFLLDLDPQTAAQRGDFGKERYEKLEFQHRVSSQYKQLITPEWKVIRSSIYSSLPSILALLSFLLFVLGLGCNSERWCTSSTNSWSDSSNDSPVFTTAYLDSLIFPAFIFVFLTIISFLTQYMFLL